jgi:hypothetical protein
MNAAKIIFSGITGTSLMTLFSYAVSGAGKKNFKEPELLAALEKTALTDAIKALALPAGWGTHYSIGIVWAAVYEYFWQKKLMKRTVKNGLILGGLSGLTGIAIWKLTFKIHPDPPRIDFRKFYIQLLIAHLIYGLGVTVTSRDSR